MLLGSMAGASVNWCGLPSSIKQKPFIYMVYYIDRLLCVEPSLHLWDKAYLVMVDNVFDVFLESVCQYFIEYFCIYVHEGDCCYISNFISDFINLDALSLPFEEVPWGSEKKQKDGPCFRIHSVNLCLFIVGKISMILLNMFSVPLSWYSSPSSIPIIRRPTTVVLRAGVAEVSSHTALEESFMMYQERDTVQMTLGLIL
ncbi:hypothetical protein STEG23_025301 [Scotinomys teguina]